MGRNAVAIIAGLIVTPFISLVTPKLKKEFTDGIFKCYDTTVSARGKSYQKKICENRARKRISCPVFSILRIPIKSLLLLAYSFAAKAVVYAALL